ncbi:hypothetical protein [Pleionea sp. CnH1-48]|uniref:hypothetical protein n=1 Tax=Pleionea sp. CnH1-48 TaxID=2954494 RepID=UPI002097A264|nr:hypothetical protein [Pleionea sp. CnH1-48]MCO7225572.1 hypothetical protein [Pleionea sp. CnH1-48]
MAKKVGVITIHGMGDTNPNYHLELVRKLRKRVGKSDWDKNVHLESCFYQDLLQANQEDYWTEADEKYDLKWDFLRKFMLFSFSDAASIEHSLSNDQRLYKQVHGKIALAFDNTLAELENANSPVVVVAHSLGSEQISNYIWDAMKNLRFFESDSGTSEEKSFRRLDSCKYLFTTGSSIPIFRAALDSPQLFERPNDEFEWHNYFDSSDVLGYPLKNMALSYEVDWLHDHEVNVGSFLTNWNPASHGQYWEDKDVIKPIAKVIEDYI